ncbi:MAG: fatty acid desaturase [Bacteroidota bacterium]
MNATSSPKIRDISQKGVLIGLTIIVLWSICLAFNLTMEVNYASPLPYLMILVQMHLFTGLFITAHDAMHGAVSPKQPKLNHFIGKLAATLFLFNSYKTLRPKHYEHHRFAGTDQDPDFHRGNENFFIWYFQFLKQYLSIWQFLAAAITFNVGKLFLPQENWILFWIIPSILSTFQLFYFGTYVPHMGEQDNPHHATSQRKNHVWAFLSCYFFGYHYEHHDSPVTPWWLLWKVKEANTERI